MDDHLLTRRALLKYGTMLAGAISLPGFRWSDPDQERLRDWSARLRIEGLAGAQRPAGSAVVRVGELAAGSPYLPGTLETYLASGSPLNEPLIASLSHFDCVTLVEACLAVSRTALQHSDPVWTDFGGEIERMRYRGGMRTGYGSRLHYLASGSAMARHAVWCGIWAKSWAAATTSARFAS
jgi:hypothetical protein